MGTSYMAAVQSAAATLNPPHLAAMFVTEGPSATIRVRCATTARSNNVSSFTRFTWR